MARIIVMPMMSLMPMPQENTIFRMTKITLGTDSFLGGSGMDLVKEPLRRLYMDFFVVKFDMFTSGLLVIVRFILLVCL